MASARSTRRSISSAVPCSAMVFGVSECASCVLMRMSGKRRLSANIRILGSARPAPISITTGLTGRARHTSRRSRYAFVRWTIHDESENSRQFGRARPPHRGQHGGV